MDSINMFPINSPLFSSPLWPLDHDSISHDQSFISLEHQISESFLSAPPSQPQDLDFPPLISNNGSRSAGDNNPTMTKKLNHNASERDRRQKINSLYSSLRSLLPLADQLKRLSNPATISRVIKYIQELQQEVEGMMKEKEELLKMDGNGNGYGFGDIKEKKSSALKSSSSFVTANQINQTEIMIQISTTNNNFFSQIFTILEEDGLLPLNASSFQSLDRRVFCNLHLQVHHSIKLEAESLSKKLLTTLQRKENMIFVEK